MGAAGFCYIGTAAGECIGLALGTISFLDDALCLGCRSGLSDRIDRFERSLWPGVPLPAAIARSTSAGALNTMRSSKLRTISGEQRIVLEYSCKMRKILSTWRCAQGWLRLIRREPSLYAARCGPEFSSKRRRRRS